MDGGKSSSRSISSTSTSGAGALGGTEGGWPLIVSLASSASVATLAGCGALRNFVPDRVGFLGLRGGAEFAVCRVFSASGPQ